MAERPQRRWPGYLAVVVLLALVVGVVAIVRSRDSTAANIFRAGETVVAVAAVVTSGHVVARPADGGKPDVRGVLPIGDPIHLAVDGGTLEQATLSFSVAADKLPPGIDPAAVLTVLTRSEQTGNQWVSAGPGDYDPAAQSLRIGVTHFSDWAYGITDPEAIRRRMAFSERSSIGLRLGRTMWGNIPPPTCPTDDIPLPFAVKAERPTPVEVCITYNVVQKLYHIEVINRRALPFSLTVPPELKVVPDVLLGTGMIGELWTHTFGMSPSRVLLRPEGKRVFTAERLPRDARITAVFDKIGWTDDMGIFMTDLALMELGDYDPLDDIPSRYEPQKAEEVRKILVSREYTDCITKEANELESKLQGGEDPALHDRIRKLMANCYSLTAEKVLDWVKQRAGSRMLRSGAEWLSKRAEMILNLPETAQMIREETDGLITLAGETTGGIQNSGAEILLKPHPPLAELHRVLPPPPTVQRDNRELLGMNMRMGFVAHDCDHVDWSWFPQHPDPDMMGTASANTHYNQGPLLIAVSLLQIAPGKTQAVRQYMDQLPQQCMGRLSTAGEPHHYIGRPDFRAGDAARFYIAFDPSNGPPGSYKVVVMSGEYVLKVEFVASDPLARNVMNADTRKLADDELARIFAHLDLYLPSRFQP